MMYKKAFRKFDKNSDGFVSYEELKEVFLARGKSEKDVQNFFNEADTDKDGKVDYEDMGSFTIPAIHHKFCCTTTVKWHAFLKPSLWHFWNIIFIIFMLILWM